MLKIDYKFKDVSLRQKAMTHSSYANEHHGTHLDCNERLEFLGDSVLGFVTADYLFTHYPELPEGELTKLRAAVVWRVRCARSRGTRHSGGDPSGHGEENGGGRKRPSIPADATEAFWARSFWTAASSARAFVLRFIPHKVDVAIAGGAFKGLQDHAPGDRAEEQAGNAGVPARRPVRPDHDKRFTMELLLNSNVFCLRHRPKQKGSGTACRQEGFGNHGLLRQHRTIRAAALCGNFAR